MVWGIWESTRMAKAAKATPKWLVFRRKAAGHSDASQPVIPTQTSHPFRGNPATPDRGGGAVRGQSSTDGTLSPKQHRGAPCQPRDCRCVRFEKFFASSTSAAGAVTRSPRRSASAATRWPSICAARRWSASPGRCRPSSTMRRWSAAVQPALHAHRGPCGRNRTGSRIHAELRRPGVTLLLLWEEYRAGQPDGYGYSRFCDLYADWRARLSPTMRQTHPAGERLFVDYAGQTVAVIDAATGETRAGADLRRRPRRLQLHLRRGTLDAGAAGLDRLPRQRLRLLRRRHAADRLRQPQGRRHRRVPL